jgi:hypothetical protein
VKCVGISVRATFTTRVGALQAAAGSRPSGSNWRTSGSPAVEPDRRNEESEDPKDRGERRDQPFLQGGSLKILVERVEDDTCLRFDILIAASTVQREAFAEPFARTTMRAYHVHCVSCDIAR